MLQALLADRFKLVLRKSTKTMPVYVLVVSKSGPKLQRIKEDSGDLRMLIGSDGRRVAGKVSIATFSNALSTWLDRPVIDRTGLNGVYNLDLRWSGDEGPEDLGLARAPLDTQQTGSTDGGDGGLPLFAAIQKGLGLRLESRKAAAEILVVEHAQRLPVEN